MLSRLSRQMCTRALPTHTRTNSVSKGFLVRPRQFFSSRHDTQLPEGSWDSHMHLINTEKFPLPKGAKTTRDATMDQALANAKRLALPKLVFVQLSNYGYDNTWILDALKRVGPAHGRGVVAFDPEQTDSQTLQYWHDQGVRGVRVNLKSSQTVLDKTEIQLRLRRYAQKLRPLKTWSIGLYADMEVLDHVHPILQELQVKIVLEHLGSPASLPLDEAKQPGWPALQSMLEDPNVYVKISAPYLFSRSVGFRSFDSLVISLLKARNGGAAVFGSDWPHTQSRGYDVSPFVQQVIEWCEGDKELERKVFRDNARKLWDA